MQPLPLSAVRALALHAQGLAVPPTESPTQDRIYDLVEQLGCVQIDTLHMVQRSQYLVLWSRLGTYDPTDFDHLLNNSNRRVFEYWLHAACIIPLTEYRYRLPKMEGFRDGGGWWPNWAKEPENQTLVMEVLDRIRQDGALRVSDFEYDGPRRGAWWDWKPAKRALEHLFNRGDLMIAGREKFQRVYDLRERVLPEWVDQTMPTEDEKARHLVERGVKALGISEAAQASEYAYEVKRVQTRAIVADLIREGLVVEVEGEVANGSTQTLVVHRDHLPLLEQAADGALKAEHATFLSPFDSLWWARGRDEMFWGFRQSLEAYRPAPKRTYGYFCLPILQRGRLIGRFDPKLERKQGRLMLRSLYLEPGIEPDDQLVADVVGAMRDFLRFHQAQEVVIERSTPDVFGAKLLAAL
jgi:uncharacterized protein YcaQ